MANLFQPWRCWYQHKDNPCPKCWEWMQKQVPRCETMAAALSDLRGPAAICSNHKYQLKQYYKCDHEDAYTAAAAPLKASNSVARAHTAARVMRVMRVRRRQYRRLPTPRDRRQDRRPSALVAA